MDGDSMTKEPQWNFGADTGVPPEVSSTHDDISASEDAHDDINAGEDAHDDVGTALDWYNSGYDHGYQDGYEAAIRDADGSTPDRDCHDDLVGDDRCVDGGPSQEDFLDEDADQNDEHFAGN